MMLVACTLALLAVVHAGEEVSKLKVMDSEAFSFNNRKVFLSGVNAAWVELGNDFGNGKFKDRRQTFQNYTAMIQQSGGNSMRVFVHNNCENTPEIDEHTGKTTGTDKSKSLIDDIKSLLNDAKEKNIFVFLVLFNMAKQGNSFSKLEGLVTDRAKTEAYIDNALRPLVKELMKHPALGGYDIINEMEGSVKLVKTNDCCTDTSAIWKSDAGFAGKKFEMEQLQRFLNHIISGIKKEDKNALVTSSSWNPRANNGQLSDSKNFYDDRCLERAGGFKGATLSFYSTHTFATASGDHYDEASPFYKKGQIKGEYGLDKPLVISAFSQTKGEGMTLSQQYSVAYTKGYAGAFAWMYNRDRGDDKKDEVGAINAGLYSISDKKDRSKGGMIHVKMNKN